ncbi:hypothetical protein HG530_007882 [Fusarium avenaceum]|nr:hypothetical protein HG530_007882 [Fusarium avenaceum]
MDPTATDVLNLYHEGLGLETHVISDSSFIARVGVVPFQQERLDAMIAQIKHKPSPQHLPRVASQGLCKLMSNPYEIRVLEIKPGTGMEKLEGALHHCSVEFNHPALKYRTRWAMSNTDYTKPVCFTALSYTWGPPVFNGSIKCDGFVKKITKSLEAAIRQFRQPHESIMMWIDQICINQEDNEEKAQQIPLMSRIYSLATSTVIWLGEASTGSASALRLLEQIISRLQFTFLNPEFEDLERLGLPAADSNQWQYLCELLSRQWFTRVWIIQEAVLSLDDSTYFSCGDSFIPWKTLADACMYLNSCGISRKLAERFSASLPSQAPLGEAICNIENMKPGGTISSIFRILIDTRYAECWDPKDRIYGLLGICNDGDRAAIRVIHSSDYTAASLYQDVAARFIRGDDLSPWMRLTQLLGAVEHESSDLPSWVPDWRLPPLMTPLSAPLTFSGVYNACGRFSHINNSGKPMATIEGNQLTAPGVFFDTIINLSDVFVNPDLSYHNPKTENMALSTSVAFASKIHHGTSKDATFEVLWKTLVAVF